MGKMTNEKMTKRYSRISGYQVIRESRTKKFRIPRYPGFLITFSLVFTLMFCLANPAYADIDIGGYFKNDIITVVKRDGERILGNLNKIRLRIDSNVIPNTNIHLEPEYVHLLKSEDMSLTGASGLDQLVWDRTYVKIYFPLADLTVGKQRIAWGTAYLWNPTDVFNPFTLTFAVAEEERVGEEAVRLEIPIGFAGNLDAVVLTGNEWDKSKKGIRGKTNIANYDLSASYVDLGDGGYQVGFDMSGEIFDFGVHSEVAFITPANEGRYSKSVFGWNYTFENGWGIDMEYFYNGLGKSDKDDYDWDALFDGKISQLAMDYLYFGTNKLLDELTQIRLSFLANVNDMSFVVYPSYTKNIAENVDLSFEALLETGSDGSEFRPTPEQDSTGFLGSNIYFVKFRFSF